MSRTERTADPAESPNSPPDAAPDAGTVTPDGAAATVDRVGTVTAWLLAVAHHHAVDAVRRDPLRRAASPSPGHRPGAESDTATDDGALLTRRARELVAGLAPEQLQALGLAYFGGHTQSEVAEMLAIPLGDVKSRTVMATDRLRPLIALIREVP